MGRWQTIAMGAGLTWACGCAQPQPHMPSGAESPASVEAPEAPVKGLSETLVARDKARDTTAEAPTTAAAAVIYVCPMHPQVTSDKPGRCPLCGMELVKKGGNP